MSNRSTRTAQSEVYLQIRPLLPGAAPGVIVSEDGCTLLVIDALCSRVQAVEFSVANLTPAQQNVLRAAFGQLPVGQPLSEWWMLDELVPVEVPDSVRLPCSDAYYELQRIESQVVQRQWYAQFGRVEGRAS